MASTYPLGVAAAAARGDKRAYVIGSVEHENGLTYVSFGSLDVVDLDGAEFHGAVVLDESDRNRLIAQLQAA